MYQIVYSKLKNGDIQELMLIGHPNGQIIYDFYISNFSEWVLDNSSNPSVVKLLSKLFEDIRLYLMLYQASDKTDDDLKNFNMSVNKIVDEIETISGIFAEGKK